MKTTLVQRRYCVDITPRQMSAILKRDWNASNSGKKKLSELMEDSCLPVNDFSYDGRYGPRIWYTVVPAYDKPELHTEIQQAIRKYAK